MLSNLLFALLPTQSSEFDRALNQALSTQQPAGVTPLPNFRLLDLSLNALVNAGTSTERNEEIESLQGGGHDPKQRGFTLSQLELSALGAVDPYFQFESHLIYLLSPEGESEFELEEVFARSSSLPHGLQLKVGQYFTEFGRVNAQHPHAWDFIDQPVINTRLFGADGMRGTGARLAWLAPMPWFSELQVGVQNSNGETMTSFRASDEESLPGGHAAEDRAVRSLADMTWSARWLQSFDLSPETVSLLGFSGAWGPSGAGASTRAAVLGADLKLKWTPKQNDAGWPFVSFQTEVMRRVYGTSLQALDPDGVPASGDEATVPGDTLRDRGGYAYLLWGFRRDWVAGLRYELARSSGAGLDPREDDPLRDDRQRFSPTLAWHPSHFSRVRLQYNLDVADHLRHDRAHSVWLGLEFMVGNHPAHTY
ncbi:MAG: hypothetical protein FJ293_11455 [Planctomycetes bacterium]|nr:hypothetical protein [Planctomycetota bacterium]